MDTATYTLGLTAYERNALAEIAARPAQGYYQGFLLDHREATAVFGIIRRDCLRRDFYRKRGMA